MMIVTLARSDSISSSMRNVAVGSSADVGSSNSTISGSTAIPDSHAAHTVADLLDDADRLAADARRQRRQRVGPAAVVAVEEVHADREVAQQHFTALWHRHGHLVELQALRTSGRVDADRTVHWRIDTHRVAGRRWHERSRQT